MSTSLLYGAALLPFISLLTLANNVVDLGYAQYRGNLTFPDTVAYLGLPFAEPPVGDRRWRSPLPLNTTRIQEESHGVVIDATAYPDFCIQGTTGRTSIILCFMFPHAHEIRCQWATLAEPGARIA